MSRAELAVTALILCIGAFIMAVALSTRGSPNVENVVRDDPPNPRREEPDALTPGSGFDKGDPLVSRPGSSVESAAALEQASGDDPSATQLKSTEVGSRPQPGTILFGDDPEWLPTPEGLFAMTAEPWSQPEFLASFGLDESDLPTMDDCLAALREEVIGYRLADAILKRIYAAEVALLPEHRRAKFWPYIVERMNIDAALSEDALMIALEGVSPYQRWREMNDKWREWSTPAHGEPGR